MHDKVEFWTWVKLSEEYEEAVLNKNPKFFEELYEKLKSHLTLDILFIVEGLLVLGLD